MTTFEAFYRSAYPAVALVAGSTAGSWTIGEEIAQEAFVRAHERWSEVADLDQPGAWVRRVAINLALNQRRSTEREQQAVERLAQPVVAHATRNTELPDRETWAAVAALAPKQRAAVVLHYHDGYSTSEIADLLETSISAVTSSLHKARATLAAALGEQA